MWPATLDPRTAHSHQTGMAGCRSHRPQDLCGWRQNPSHIRREESLRPRLPFHLPRQPRDARLGRIWHPCPADRAPAWPSPLAKARYGPSAATPCSAKTRAFSIASKCAMSPPILGHVVRRPSLRLGAAWGSGAASGAWKCHLSAGWRPPVLAAGGSATAGDHAQWDGINDRTEIAYTLLKVAGEGQVEIEIFALSGRPVRRLYSGRERSGHYLRPWDGRGDDGLMVTPGLYLFQVRLNADRGITKDSGLIAVVY